MFCSVWEIYMGQTGSVWYSVIWGGKEEGERKQTALGLRVPADRREDIITNIHKSLMKKSENNIP
jgi:hypothetical protein